MNDKLTDHLDRRAEDFVRHGGTELDLSQVLARAGEIRRGRRMRATLVMAAAVMAIAVPTVLVANQGRDDSHVTPAHQSRTDRSPIALQDLKDGDRPKTGWVQGNVWQGPDGQESTWNLARGDRLPGVAVLGKATLMTLADSEGRRTVRLVPPVGATARVESWPMQGDVAVSADDKVAAYVRPDGTPVVLQDGHDPVLLPRIPATDALTASAVAGEGCSSPGAGECTVWASSQGPRPVVWQSVLGGGAQRFGTGLRTIADRDTHGLLAGTTSVTDSGSCSALEAPDARTLWQTCDHTLLSFSPDSQHLLATTAYRDGLGDTELAVLNSHTGNIALDLVVADGAAITQMVWEDDSHVLATVFEKGRWAVLRVGLDGSRQYAVPPVTGQDTESPFVLPSR